MQKHRRDGILASTIFSRSPSRCPTLLCCSTIRSLRCHIRRRRNTLSRCIGSAAAADHHCHLVSARVTAIGYLVWFFWLLGGRPNPELHSELPMEPHAPRLGLPPGLCGVALLGLLPPTFAHLDATRRARVLAAWIALCVILLIGGTLRPSAGARHHRHPLLGMIVVLADGVGWTAACIKQSL